jgi:hypothetical protein
MDIVISKLIEDEQTAAVPSYLVTSTAPFNVEDASRALDHASEANLKDVIEHLYQNSQRQRQQPKQDCGLVITIHGYNTGPDSTGNDGVVDVWYRPLADYINQADPFIQAQSGRFVYLGYRWPSESLKKKGIRIEALGALPFLLNILVCSGLLLTILSMVFMFSLSMSMLAFLTILGVVLFSIVFCLYALRVSVYFRDAYRANNFGVTDLVELIRRLDQGLVERKMNETLTSSELVQRLISDIPQLQYLDTNLLTSGVQTIRKQLSVRPDVSLVRENPRFVQFIHNLESRVEFRDEISRDTLQEIVEHIARQQERELKAAQDYWENNPIKLSMIGHSMGGHVTTQTVRILSDVFDPRSVGTVQEDSAQKFPSPRVGRVFSLGRLILVSPDIPVLAITSGRSNFLRSSLRRFEEAYLFSNEGDLALRIASTAANYFSFPARSRTQGYRLGNVTILSGHLQRIGHDSTSSAYGIVNLAELLQGVPHHLLPYLGVSVLNRNTSQSLDPSNSLNCNQSSVTCSQADADQEAIADLFTYVDCTEYRDYTDYNRAGSQQEHNVLILDKQRSPLRLWDYARLFMAYAQFSPKTFPRGRDVHGGYFAGRLTQLLLYRLAFLGFEGLINSLIDTPTEALGLPPQLPPDLERAIVEARTTVTSDDSRDDKTIHNKRYVAAIQLLSWICQQKRIQVAVSPERFKVDIAGLNREVAREVMLTED